jgi:L-ribulokinase
MLVQIYADVTGKPLYFAGSAQAPALGSAMHAAVAAGVYPDIQAAAEKMGKLKDEVVRPVTANEVIYNRLYTEYRTLYDYFGRGANNVMKTLKRIKAEVLGQ